MIWQRHLFARLSKTLLLILGALFAVYFFVDLSIHSVRFFSCGKTELASLLMYYVHSFSLHLDLFFSLAFLLASLRVLFEASYRNEWISLQMAGLPMRRLIRPLFILAALLSLLLYANAEWLAPSALDSTFAFRNEHAKRKRQTIREHLHDLKLEDGTKLIYQQFDPENKMLFDVFWIADFDELWHMKKLSLGPPLKGQFVDHLKRSPQNQLVKFASYPERDFPELLLSADQALQKYVPIECRSLSQLIQGSVQKGADRSMVRAHLNYKLALPLLPFLISVALPPICLRHRRAFSAFLIAACALFAFVGFITVLDGMLILAENQVLAPTLAIWPPCIAAWILSLCLFFKFA